MVETIRTNFDKKTWQLIYDKLAELGKKKLKKITVSEAIEVLLKDAYLREKEKN